MEGNFYEWTIFKPAGSEFYKAKRIKGHKPDGSPLYLVLTLNGKMGQPRITTKAKAEQWRKGQREKALLGEPDVATTPEESITVSAICVAHLFYLRRYYATPDGVTSSYWNAYCALKKFAGEFGDTPLDALKAKDIADALDNWAESGDYAAKTLNEYLSFIRRTIQWAVTKEKVDSALYHAVRAIPNLQANRSNARESGRREPVSDALINQTLPLLPRHLAAMVQIQRLTGARPDEVCKLRGCDMDMSGPVWIFTVPGHKTAHLGKVREIDIGPKAQAILKPFLLRPADEYCFDPRESYREQMKRGKGRRPGQKRSEKDAPSTSRTIGARYTSHAYARAIGRICEANGIAKWTPYQIRHTRATEVEKAHGPIAAALTLGNDAKVVEKHYVHRDREIRHKIALESG